MADEFEHLKGLFKQEPMDWAKRMLIKKYPKLAETDFDVRQKMYPCPKCKKKAIPGFEIKRETDQEFQDVPIQASQCIKCEDRKNALESDSNQVADRIRRETAPFWVIPYEIQDATLANYESSDGDSMEAFQAAVQYVKDYKSGDIYNLFYRGTYGVGKSHLLKAIAETIKQMSWVDKYGRNVPYKVGFITLEELIGMIKGTFGRREGETEHTIIKKVIDLDFLVIDDIGTESGEWAGKKLFDIVNGRQGKATAYTSNFCDWDELAERYDINGGKLMSRIRQNTKVVDIDSTDKRIEKQRG